jgi:radical SAM protein with 4Fe4S-binding SPASM domain
MENEFMLYRQMFDTFIRIYDDVGYIVNKSNFIDRVTDSAGAIFLKALSRSPKSLETITNEIKNSFIDANESMIRHDIINFYIMLEEDGFIISGNTIEELNQKDKRFSYNALEPKTIKNNFEPSILRAKKDTKEFFNEHFKDKPHLVSFQIELTSRCNEQCVHCYIPSENKKLDIEPSLLYETLDQCKEMNLLDITFSGGEPMLHPNFLDFLKRAKSYDFSVNVLSNLTLLNDEILFEMKENRISSVQVSLYSMNPNIHDSITKIEGSFYKTHDAIIKLIENDIPLQISCPTMKQNKNSYSDVMKWAHDHKIRAVTDYIMMARYDHSVDNLINRLSLDEVGKIINDIIENDIDYQKLLCSEDFYFEVQKERSDDPVCAVCISSMCMVANGNVYPCAGWQSYVLGNLYNEKLRSIWNNSVSVKYLRNIRKKDFPECMYCEDKAFCAMCMVRNANENPDGDPFKINKHFCNVAALNRKIIFDWKAKNIFVERGIQI